VVLLGILLTFVFYIFVKNFLFKIKIFFSAQVLVGLTRFVCSSQLVLYPGPNVQNNEPHAFNAGPFMINRAVEVFDPAVQQVNTPAASATNQGYWWGKRNRAADVLYEPTINAVPIAKDGNGAVGPSNPAASTNTAVPPASNRYYVYYGYPGYPYLYYGDPYGKRSNPNSGYKLSSTIDDEPTITAAQLLTNGNRAMGPSNPAASTNTAAPPPSNRYYGYQYPYGYSGYGSYGKRSNSNGGHKLNSAADDVPTINAAPMVTNGNRAMGPSNPGASTNTAAPPPSNRYYGYQYPYGYSGYGSYGKRSNSNGGHKFNSPADDVPTINAALMVTNRNSALGPSNPAASTNTAAPPPSNRYYGYQYPYGYSGYGSNGKKSNSNGGHKFNRAADDVPTINAAPMVTNGNRAVDFLYPAASTNTAPPSASNRYYYGYGGFPY
jgi:hypothetical protein